MYLVSGHNLLDDRRLPQEKYARNIRHEFVSLTFSKPQCLHQVFIGELRQISVSTETRYGLPEPIKFQGFKIFKRYSINYLCRKIL